MDSGLTWSPQGARCPQLALTGPLHRIYYVNIIESLDPQKGPRRGCFFGSEITFSWVTSSCDFLGTLGLYSHLWRLQKLRARRVTQPPGDRPSPPGRHGHTRPASRCSWPAPLCSLGPVLSACFWSLRSVFPTSYPFWGRAQEGSSNDGAVSPLLFSTLSESGGTFRFTLRHHSGGRCLCAELMAFGCAN